MFEKEAECLNLSFDDIVTCNKTRDSNNQVCVGGDKQIHYSRPNFYMYGEREQKFPIGGEDHLFTLWFEEVKLFLRQRVKETYYSHYVASKVGLDPAYFPRVAEIFY